MNKPNRAFGAETKKINLMKINHMAVIAILIAVSSCVSQNRSESHIENGSLVNGLYPIQIEIGAFGRSSNISPTILVVDQDSVRVSTRINNSSSEMKNYSIGLKSTLFEKTLSKLEEGDLEGNKHYYNPRIRDGGYVKISSEKGMRKFTNVFSSHNDKSKIRPDTIGLAKFEDISIYANFLLQEISK